MKQARILVVEDESLIQRVLVRTLEEAGYQAVAVDNGWEGWRQAQNQEFDLLVTDHVMPIMGGMQLVKHVRERFPSMPVIVVSGNFIKGDTPSEYPPDAVLLAKPFQNETLVDTVRKLLGRGRPSPPPSN